MLESVRFGLGLLRLHAGAAWSQILLKKEDDNQPYRGRKIPLQITHSCTWKCNYKCIHCGALNDSSKKDASTESVLRMIDQAAKAGAVKMGFTGGEPLVRKDIPEIMERCAANGLVTSMVSNGLLVPQNVEVLKKLNLLFLSMDGNRAVHEHVRGTNSWDVLMKAIEIARVNRISVAALTTLGSFNVGCVEEMSKVIMEQKIHWMVGLVQVQFDGKQEQCISKEKIMQSVEILRKNRFLRTSRSYLEFICKDKPPRFCFAGIGYAFVSPDLVLYPCGPAYLDPSYPGISLESKSLEEAFNELPLYRRTCDSCRMACHIEANYLWLFSPDNIIQSMKLMKSAG
jgi:MoaA/NifB/PqqE/SkfB family radical SAM enzyme